MMHALQLKTSRRLFITFDVDALKFAWLLKPAELYNIQWHRTQCPDLKRTISFYLSTCHSADRPVDASKKDWNPDSIALTRCESCSLFLKRSWISGEAARVRDSGREGGITRKPLFLKHVSDWRHRIMALTTNIKGDKVIGVAPRPAVGCRNLCKWGKFQYRRLL